MSRKFQPYLLLILSSLAIALWSSPEVQAGVGQVNGAIRKAFGAPVNATGATNGQVLTFNSTSGQWDAQTKLTAAEQAQLDNLVAGTLALDTLFLDVSTKDVSIVRDSANRAGIEDGASSGGGLVVGAGTALAPSIAVDEGTSGKDNGMFLSSPNILGFAANGTGIMTLAVNGLTMLGNQVVQWDTDLSPITAANTVLSALSMASGNISNEGAVALTNFDIPTVTADGSHKGFVRVASFAMRITPGTNEKFIGFSGGALADNEYLELASDGAAIYIVSVNSGDWTVVHESGDIVSSTGIRSRGMSSWIRNVQDKTSNYTILATESGALFTNSGAGSSDFAFTLPTISSGLTYTIKQVDSGTVSFSPPAAAAITFSGGEMDLDEALETNGVGHSLTATAGGGTLWLITSEVGTPVEETP